MLPFVLVTLFVSLFFTFAKFAMDKYNDGFSGSCNKELILALIFLINAGIVFGASFIPVKTNNYTVNLKDGLAFDDEKPYESLKIEEWTPLALFGGSLRFTSYSKNGIVVPDDEIAIKTSTNIRFKKGKKNCIHYKKEINIFGDESKAANDIIIEYNAKNVNE